MTRINRIEIRRGRQDEFERTDTGTATIFVNDTDGTFDPTNASGPYFGTLDSAPVALAIRNPVTDEWSPLFRGIVDSYGSNLVGSKVKEEIAIHCVDALDYLANFELAPGLAGDLPPAESEGYVYYAETAGTVDDRIIQALTDAGWPSTLWSVFTGNVRVQETVYSPGESILTVIQDAADAEFSTVANLFVDRFGFVVFHGRYARFSPDTVSASATHWDFHRWKAGDGAAVEADITRAHIRPPFSFSRGRGMLRNAALAYPMRRPGDTIPDVDLATLVVTDAGSIADHGTRSWSAENLIVQEGTTTGNDANEECKLYSQYMVDNYGGDPTTRIDQITFKSLRPEDPRAAANWALICGVDISDIIDVQISHPGGGGFSEEFYVEGLTYQLTPLVKDLDLGYPAVELTLDLSPVSYWANQGDLGG